MTVEQFDSFDEFSEAFNLTHLNKAWRLDKTFRVENETISVRAFDVEEQINLCRGDYIKVLGQTDNGLTVETGGKELFLPWHETMKIHVFGDHNLLGPEHRLED